MERLARDAAISIFTQGNPFLIMRGHGNGRGDIRGDYNYNITEGDGRYRKRPSILSVQGIGNGCGSGNACNPTYDNPTDAMIFYDQGSAPIKKG